MARGTGYRSRTLGKGLAMQWVLTAIVLSSVSLLVVTLTMEDGQALDPRSHGTLSRRRMLLHLLMVARSLALSAGHVLGTAGRTAAERLLPVAVGAARRAGAFGRAALTTAEVRFRSRSQQLSGPATASGNGRTRPLRFEHCLQMTGPELTVLDAAPRSTLSLAPLPGRISWLSRALSVFELVFVILAAGGAIALALFAIGWKAARVF
jgi:hypothetical protein